MSRRQVRLTAAYFLRTFAFCVWCYLSIVYRIIVLFVYCVQYYGAVCVLCTVSWCCLCTVYSIKLLFTYCVDYYGTVYVLCTVLWCCFHTMCSNIVVLAYHVLCRAVSAGFTFPTPNNLTSDHEFHILFTFQCRITQRNPQD
jgi:hypothetical protein